MMYCLDDEDPWCDVTFVKILYLDNKIYIYIKYCMYNKNKPFHQGGMMCVCEYDESDGFNRI